MAKEQKKKDTSGNQEGRLVHTEKEGPKNSPDTEKKPSHTEEERQEQDAGSSEYTTKYHITELAEAAQSLFHTNSVIVRAALKAAGKSEYTEKEALEAVGKFKGKEIK